MNQTHKINWCIPEKFLSKKDLLAQYTAEINKRFNGTARTFVHGEITTSYTPLPLFSKEQLQKTNYDVWVVVTESTTGYSGNAFAAYSGDGSRICYISFNDIYYIPGLVEDHNSGSPWEMTMQRQIGSIVHEIGHGAGLGYGEIYKLATVEDPSTDSFKTNLSFINPNDVFWTRHSDWLNTYMLTAAGTRWAPYEKKALEENYSVYYNDIPSADLNNIKLRIVDNNGVPYNNANVKIWRQFKLTATQPNIYFTGASNNSGEVIFPWGFLPEISSDILRFLQVEFKGILKEFWISCQEAQEQFLLYGRQTWNIKLNFDTGAVTFTDDAGGEIPPVSSEPENITVSITNPKNGDSFVAPAGILIQSLATSDKSISKVEYFNGTTKLGEATAAPYFLSVSLNAGIYNLVAKATGQTGKVVSSSIVALSVSSPASTLNINLTSPKSSDSYSASTSEPANVTISANITSSSQITKVEFYNGANLIKTLTAAPYTTTVNLLAGVYTLSAKAYTMSSNASDSALITVKEITTTPPVDNIEIKLLKESIIALKNSINALNSKIDGITNGSVGITIKLNK